MACYDSAILLTRRSPLGMSALLSYMNLRNGSVTAVARASKTDRPVMGQIRCAAGRRNARLTFLYPEQAYASPSLPVLLDGLAQQAGFGGAFGVLAEVDELSPVFEILRRSGYAVYGWQRVYRMPFTGRYDGEHQRLWRFATPEDEISIRQLFQSLVPPLTQSANPLPHGRLYGLVCQDNGQALAYIEISYGPDGIYLRPLIHPNVNNMQTLLRSIEGHLLPLMGRRVYLAVRSHQAWLENPLTLMGADAAARQALMVKHLSSMQRQPLPRMARSVIEEGAPEPTARVEPSAGTTLEDC